MIDANTGLQVWSQTWDRRVAEIFEIQNQISTTIAQKLIGTLNVSASPPVPTRDIEADTLLLRANHLMKQRGAIQLDRAIELYQRAIAPDSRFARALNDTFRAQTSDPDGLTCTGEPSTVDVSAD